MKYAIIVTTKEGYKQYFETANSWAEVQPLVDLATARYAGCLNVQAIQKGE